MVDREPKQVWITKKTLARLGPKMSEGETIEARVFGFLPRDTYNIITSRSDEEVAVIQRREAKLREDEEFISTMGDVEASPEEKLLAASTGREMRHTIQNEVQNALDALTTRERRVLELRFGLEDGHSRSLREVGQEIGRSKSTAWRVEKRVLERLSRLI